MIKLNQIGTLVDLTGVRSVKKAYSKHGGYYPSVRWIEITYVDGRTITVEYGGDNHYYDTYNPKLDLDFKQIEDLLCKGGV